MKCKIPEISWHNREPVLCIDIQPVENEFYRLATGGSDCHVLIWHAKIAETGTVTVDMVSDLTRHQRSVNAVRWSPNGQYLASADDDANIIIWNLKTDNIPLLEGDTTDKEIWVITKIMRGHKDDIYDICWSPSGLKLLSGSIDNTAIIWDFAQGKIETILTDHKGFVQGVAWDPKGEYITTLCSDRLCRIFEKNGKHVRARIGRGTLPVPESHPLYEKDVKYFHDDTFKSYFRRITFSPDGNLIIAPAGCVETEDTKKAMCGTYLFSIDNLTQPAAIVPLQKQCSSVVRCCPILYELRANGPEPVIDLPYRMIIAVASESDLILYDTQQLTPFAHLQKIHYTRLTDLAWSSNGRLLVACSTDGFCTLLTFDPNELGTPYVKEESEVDESFLNVSGCEELEKDLVENKSRDEKPKKESFLLQWANKTKDDSKKTSYVKPLENDNQEDCKENKSNNKSEIVNDIVNEIVNTGETRNPLSVETIEILSSPEKTEISKKNVHRRIVPIQLSSPCNSNKKQVTGTKVTPTRRKGKSSDTNHSRETKSKPLMEFLKGTNKTSDVAETISEESSNARDAWNSETKTIEIIEDEDDMAETTPDFELHLEESTTSPSKLQNASKSIQNNQSIDTADKKQEDIDMTSVETAENKSQKKECNVQQITLDTKSDLNTESLPSSESNVKKTPRRIQLITLSSPKHKKQKTNT